MTVHESCPDAALIAMCETLRKIERVWHDGVRRVPRNASVDEHNRVWDHYQHRWSELYDRIKSTPATTVKGLRAKLSAAIERTDEGEHAGEYCAEMIVSIEQDVEAMVSAAA